jgi:hypothetical protein
VQDFRNYVLGVYQEASPHINNHLELDVNGRNPVLTANELPISVRNHRQKIWEGRVAAVSPDGLYAEQQQRNDDETMRESNDFTLPVTPGKSGIGLAGVQLRLAAFEKDVARALLVTDASKASTEKHGGTLAVTNGGLRFAVAPGYSDSLTSLSIDGREWLFSNHPKREPYSWWNPFIGGVHTLIDRMSYSQVLRETITASFTEETDTLGNVWTGVRTDLTVEQFDEYRGLRYSQYYLTLPGVPVLCHFARFQNGTGRYLKAEAGATAFIAGKDDLDGLFVALRGLDKQEYRMRVGTEELDMDFDRLAVISREGTNARNEKLYLFSGAKHSGGSCNIDFDINILYCHFNTTVKAADGQSAATPPLLCLLTDKALTHDMLTDWDRITFDGTAT